MRYQTKNDQLNQLDGDLARMDVSREEYKVYKKGAKRPLRCRCRRAASITLRNCTSRIFECVKTRNKPTAPMHLGFQAALVVQMANMSLRAGRRMRWNAAAGRVES
jgi:hypothetical protein